MVYLFIDIIVYALVIYIIHQSSEKNIGDVKEYTVITDKK